MGETTDSAKKQFHGVQASMKTLYEESGRAVAGIKDRLDNLEKNQTGKSGKEGIHQGCSRIRRRIGDSGTTT
jgi:hypothetical protein